MADRSCIALSSCLCYLVAFPIMYIIFHAVFHPSIANISIETALLAHAVNADRNIVDVNITTNVNVRNPSRRFGVYYERVEADAYHKGAKLPGSGTMPPFYVGHRSNAVVGAVFWSESCYNCSDPGKLDDSTGWFDVDLWICPDKYKYRLGAWTLTDYHEPPWRCEFALRLVANETTKTDFSSNPCYRPTLGKFHPSGC